MAIRNRKPTEKLDWIASDYGKALANYAPYFNASLADHLKKGGAGFTVYYAGFTISNVGEKHVAVRGPKDQVAKLIDTDDFRMAAHHWQGQNKDEAEYYGQFSETRAMDGQPLVVDDTKSAQAIADVVKRYGGSLDSLVTDLSHTSEKVVFAINGRFVSLDNMAIVVREPNGPELRADATMVHRFIEAEKIEAYKTVVERLREAGEGASIRERGQVFTLDSERDELVTTTERTVRRNVSLANPGNPVFEEIISELRATAPNATITDKNGDTFRISEGTNSLLYTQIDRVDIRKSASEAHAAELATVKVREPLHSKTAELQDQAHQLKQGAAELKSQERIVDAELKALERKPPAEQIALSAFDWAEGKASNNVVTELRSYGEKIRHGDFSYRLERGMGENDQIIQGDLDGNPLAQADANEVQAMISNLKDFGQLHQPKDVDTLSVEPVVAQEPQLVETSSLPTPEEERLQAAQFFQANNANGEYGEGDHATYVLYADHVYQFNKAEDAEPYQLWNVNNPADVYVAPPEVLDTMKAGPDAMRDAIAQEDARAFDAAVAHREDRLALSAYFQTEGAEAGCENERATFLLHEGNVYQFNKDGPEEARFQVWPVSDPLDVSRADGDQKAAMLDGPEAFWKSTETQAVAVEQPTAIMASADEIKAAVSQLDRLPNSSANELPYPVSEPFYKPVGDIVPGDVKAIAGQALDYAWAGRNVDVVSALQGAAIKHPGLSEKIELHYEGNSFRLDGKDVVQTDSHGQQHSVPAKELHRAIADQRSEIMAEFKTWMEAAPDDGKRTVVERLREMGPGATATIHNESAGYVYRLDSEGDNLFRKDASGKEEWMPAERAHQKQALGILQYQEAKVQSLVNQKAAEAERPKSSVEKAAEQFEKRREELAAKRAEMAARQSHEHKAKAPSIRI